jgi:hypothetical protein
MRERQQPDHISQRVRAMSPDIQTPNCAISNFSRSPADTQNTKPINKLNVFPLSPLGSELPSEIRLKNFKDQER